MNKQDAIEFTKITKEILKKHPAWNRVIGARDPQDIVQDVMVMLLAQEARGRAWDATRSAKKTWVQLILYRWLQKLWTREKRENRAMPRSVHFEADNKREGRASGLLRTDMGDERDLLLVSVDPISDLESELDLEAKYLAMPEPERIALVDALAADLARPNRRGGSGNIKVRAMVRETVEAWERED